MSKGFTSHGVRRERKFEKSERMAGDVESLTPSLGNRTVSLGKT